MSRYDSHRKIRNLNESAEMRKAQADSTETEIGRDKWDKDSTTYRTVEQYSIAWNFSKETVWSGKHGNTPCHTRNCGELIIYPRNFVGPGGPDTGLFQNERWRICE